MLAVIMLMTGAFAVGCGGGGTGGGDTGGGGAATGGGAAGSAGGGGTTGGGQEGEGTVTEATLAGADAFVSSDPADQTGAGKVIGIASQHQNNDWNVYLCDSIKGYLTERGYEIRHTEANYVTAQQVRDVENFIVSGVDGIIIAGGEPGAFVDVSLQSKEAGVPLCAVDMTLPGSFAVVSADNLSVGVAMGQAMVLAMNGKGKIMELSATGWESCDERSIGAKLVWNKYPEMVLVNTFEVMDDAIGTSYSYVKSVLQSDPDLAAVFSNWGQPSVGAYQAIVEAGLQDQIINISADFDVNVAEAMAAPDSPLWFQMGQDPGFLGIKIAYAMDMYFIDPDAVPAILLGPTYLATNGNRDTDMSVLYYTSLDEQWDISFPTLTKPW